MALSKEEYRNAQIAHRNFFEQQSKHKYKIKDFLSVYNSNPTYFIPKPLPAIIFDNIPSRSRIMLIAEIIDQLNQPNTVTKKIPEETTTVVYKVGNQVFTCEHRPTVEQPGNIHLKGVGSYDPQGIPAAIEGISDQVGPYTIANITTKSRKMGTLITKHAIAAEAGFYYEAEWMRRDAEYLNQFVFLWDIEVARHLFQDRYGGLPIGCGIARIQKVIGRKPYYSYYDFLLKPSTDTHNYSHIFSGSLESRINALKLTLAWETSNKSEEQFTQVHIFLQY